MKMNPELEAKTPMANRSPLFKSIRKYLAALAICGLANFAHAEKRHMVVATQGYAFPQFKEYVTEAGYYSTGSCLPSNLGNVIISSTPANLFTIHVTSAGQGAATIDAWDANTSTGSNTSGGITRRLTATIDASKTGNWPFSVHASSGIAVSIQGGVPPCWNVIYAEK